MRCFIGIPVQGSLAKACLGLSANLPGAAPPDNLHMTLAFLGECGPRQVEELEAALARLTASCQPFQVRLLSCEPFPRENGPFLALTGDPTAPLLDLHRSVMVLVAEQGMEPELRPYRPHVTLAKPARELPVIRGDWTLPVDSVWLYQSLRDDNGKPIYRSLARFPLSGP